MGWGQAIQSKRGDESVDDLEPWQRDAINMILRADRPLVVLMMPRIHDRNSAMIERLTELTKE